MARHGRGKRGHEQTRKVIHKQSRKRVSNIHVGAPLDDLDDDIDKFPKGSDKIPLDMNDDSELSPDEREEPIFNLKADGSEEDDDMEDDLDDEQLSGLAAKIAKQAKMLRQKRSLTEDEEDDEGGNEKERKAAWGKRKNMYYSADNVDYELQSSDEEAPAEEEAEALRLQRLKAESLRPEDFELDEEDDVVAPLEVHEHTLQEIVERQEAEDKKEKQHLSPKSCRIGGFGEDAKVLVEEVKKDIQALSKEEQMSVVMSDAPELVGLLAELREGLDELQNRIGPLLHKVKEGNLATKEGIHFFETKHMLLLCYCQSIVFYLIMKAEGRSVRDHPVIARLVEIRMLLEKLRPVEKKLHDQIDRLMSLVKERFLIDGIRESHGREDNSNNKQIKDLLDLKMDGDSVESNHDLPTVNSSLLLKGDISERRELKAEAEYSRGPTSDRRKVENELADTYQKTERVVGAYSKEMLRERAKLESLSQDNINSSGNGLMLKVGLGKSNQMKCSRNGLMRGLDDFDDEVPDFVEWKQNPLGGKILNDCSKPRKLSQVIAEAGQRSKKLKVLSGDADLPAKADLGERRSKLEMQKVSKFHDGEEGIEEKGEIDLNEDEFYQAAKQMKDAKYAAKALVYSRAPSAAPEVEAESGKRHISYQMEKNKGLTPHRKKLTKNPRKKYKVKHQKAVIRRKGQVREVKLPHGPYGGETTGIRTNISRSIRFQS